VFFGLTNSSYPFLTFGFFCNLFGVFFTFASLTGEVGASDFGSDFVELVFVFAERIAGNEKFSVNFDFLGLFGGIFLLKKRENGFVEFELGIAVDLEIWCYGSVTCPPNNFMKTGDHIAGRWNVCLSLLLYGTKAAAQGTQMES